MRALPDNKVLWPLPETSTETLFLVVKPPFSIPSGRRIGTSRDSLALFLEQTGRYTIVTQSNIRGTGDYEVHLAFGPGANELGRIPNGGTRSGSIDAINEVDSFTFVGVAGETGLLTQTSTLANGTRVLLINPDGTRLTGGTNNSVFLSLDQTGIYTVIVRSRLQPDTGSYTVSLNLQRPVPLAAVSYAALGDSYSSGEGVPPYLDPTDTLLSGCHRSTRAYSTLLQRPGDFEPLASQLGIDFDFYACSGAVVNNVSASGAGQNGEPPQLAPSNNVDGSRDLITMTISGNDIEFVKIAGYCFVVEECDTFRPFEPVSDLTVREVAAALLARAQTRLSSLIQELRNATPNATTLLAGYPILVSGRECDAARVFGTNLLLSASEQQWLRDFNQDLNTMIQATAATTGVHYVDIEDHFAGHEVCGVEDDWIAGLRAPDIKTSFHPTARGQREYARVLNDYLFATSILWPFGYNRAGFPNNPPPVLPSNLPAEQAELLTTTTVSPTPEFGELLVTIAAAPATCSATESVAVPGGSARLQAEGFAPGETVTLRFRLSGNNASTALGTATVDTNGTLDATVAVPSTVPVSTDGVIEVLGLGPQGGGYLAFSMVTFAAATTIDGDGDGVPDACDNCPSDPNANQEDGDLDGVGNACDVCGAERFDDADNDGQCASIDFCPLDPLNDADGDGVCGDVDNCSSVPNADQLDANGDGIGDACATLGCFSVDVNVNDEAYGDVSVPASACALNGYFEGSTVQLMATPVAGGVFEGWTGDVKSFESTLDLSVSSDVAVTAIFCSENTFVANGNTCDPNVTIPIPWWALISLAGGLGWFGLRKKKSSESAGL